MINDEVYEGVDLNCMEEEADSRLILHVAYASVEGFINFLVLSNDSNVVTYLSVCFNQLKTNNVKKLRLKYGLKERLRNRLADIFGSG